MTRRANGSGWRAVCALAAAWSVSACGYDSPDRDDVGHTVSALLGEEVCPAGSNIIHGTAGDDVIDGTNGPDCIFGHGGDDTLRGHNGADVLVGGDGDDLLEGGNGDDRLEGEAGNDVLAGENGADIINGGGGNDVITGERGDDIIDGGDGNDAITGGRGADTLDGGDGDDVIDDGRGDDAVDGGNGNDACEGDDCELDIPELTECASDGDCAAGTSCALPAGICVACMADAECDDGNVCTTESCQPVLGCSNPILPDGTPCPDDTVCNGDETCVTATCTAGTPLVCDDGQFCNGVESCDPVDACQPGTPPATDDGVACTDDSCDEAADVIVNATNDAHCDAGFVCEPDGCTPWCTQIDVQPGVTRCVRAPGDGTVSLHLSPSDMTPWEQEWEQADEPEVNYCGPTAARNLLFWYDNDVFSYNTLAGEMRTNDWEEGIGLFGLAAAACGGELICAGIVYVILRDSVIEAGSLPGDVASSLSSHTPAGWTFCSSAGTSAIGPVRNALENGSPVYYLESRGEGNLHWAVITGLYDDGGTLTVRVANSADRSWADFVTDWSLQPVGGGLVRDALSVLGLVPHVRYHYAAPGQPCQ